MEIGLLSKYTEVQHKVLRTVYDGLNNGRNQSETNTQETEV